MKLLRATLILLTGTLLFPCAVDTTPRFIPGNLPEQFNDRFLKGQLGILTPFLGKRYELIAWRYLSGLPLGAEEQAGLGLRPISYSDSITEWQKARGGNGYISGFRQSRIAQNEFYENCLSDAFATALSTLNDRTKAYANAALVAQWAAAQDEVFSNCSGQKTVYPANLDPSLPALARADRLYQIAAAHFYAEDLDEALNRFQAIAEDSASPWRDTAAYMVGRVLLRESVLLKKPEAEAQAKAQFLKIAANPGSGRFQDSARGLAEYLTPETQFSSVSREFVAPHPGAGFAETLASANYLMQAERYKEAFAAPNLPEPFDWIRAFEAKDEAAPLARWKQTHSELWLIPALFNATAKDPDTPALIEAAGKVPETSPAYDTATFHAIRLTIESGKTAEARTRLDRLLSGPARPLASVDNAFRRQRLGLATDFDDFLRWAPRKPIGYADYLWDEGKTQSSPTLDFDSVDVFNQATPLARLIHAAESKSLPAWPASEIARTAFTRALVLGDDASAARIAPILAKAHPNWAADLKAYADATAGEKRFLAAFLVERQSGLNIHLYSEVKPEKDESEFDQWWCAEKIPEKPPVPTFFSDAERTEAAAQLKRLNAAGPAQAFISPTVMSWAKAHPDDPRIPEALGRIVRMTRYGCRGIPENGPISKVAFDLLHVKYPSSDWAKKTPYWFKD